MTDSDYISRLLGAERVAGPPNGSAEAGLRRLLTTMATHAAPLPVAVGSLKLGMAAIAKWVGVGFVIGTLGTGLASYVSHAAIRAPAVARPAPALVSSGVARPAPANDLTAAGRLPSALPDPPPNDSKRRAAVSAALATAAPSVSPTFDEELRLITAAKHELDAGRGHLARVWLEEHSQRFPRGVFSLEREGLLVLVSCSASPKRELARQFASQHPDSPMLEQLLRRCGVEGPLETPRPESAKFLKGGK